MPVVAVAGGPADGVAELLPPVVLDHQHRVEGSIHR
jgi:hypothetical protein